MTALQRLLTKIEVKDDGDHSRTTRLNLDTRPLEPHREHSDHGSSSDYGSSPARSTSVAGRPAHLSSLLV